MSSSRPRLVVAGGGTGGHLFPGIAIAKRVCETFPETRVLFIGTDRPFEKEQVAKAKFYHSVSGATGIKGLGWQKKLKAAVRIPLSVLNCMVKLIRFRADAVVGVGGFSSGPVILAAWLLRRPVVLHEQNSVPGIANRLAARFAKRIFITFPESEAFFPEGKCTLSGNPVRDEILQAAKRPPQADKPTTLLVAGGSQGARGINKAITQALTELKALNIQIIHQCGENDLSKVKEAYQKAEISASVTPFIQNMHEAFEKADLIVGRAGATTLSELMVMGKPSILVPFPQATDNHQEKNGRYLEKAGAARVILESELEEGVLSEAVQSLLADPEALSAMGKAARSLAMEEADRTVADAIVQLMGQETKP